MVVNYDSHEIWDKTYHIMLIPGRLKVCWIKNLAWIGDLLHKVQNKRPGMKSLV